MKANRLAWSLLLFLLNGLAVQISAQQSEGDRKLFEEIKTKAENGDAAAQSKLANMYLAGKGVERDFKESAKWALQSAEKGELEAQEILGFLYDGGYGVKENPEEMQSCHGVRERSGNRTRLCRG